MGYRILCVDISSTGEAKELDEAASQGYKIVTTAFGHNPHTCRPCMIYTLERDGVEVMEEGTTRRRRTAAPSETK